MWTKLLLLGLGGATGTILRYLIAGWVQHLTGSTFPWGTLIVNVSGCLAIGFLAMLLYGPVLTREEYRVALLIGVLGGYTTFSTFGRETFALANQGQLWAAGANIVLCNVFGLLAVWLGHRLAERLFGT